MTRPLRLCAPFLHTLLLSLLLAAGPPTTQEAERAEKLWAEAIEALDSGREKEAAAVLEQVVQILPDNPAVWHNLGQTRQNLGEHEPALKAFAEVERLEPANWRALAKQVQCLQALGRSKLRDEIIARLYALREDEAIDEPFFCREQFSVEGQKVMAYERFELEGERAVRWSFYVVDEAGEIIDRWSVGSYEGTTAMSREVGNIKPDERLFHLDRYPPGGGHGTFAFYVNQPEYEVARADFIKGLTGETRPMSQSGGYRPVTRPATRPTTSPLHDDKRATD